MSGYRTHLRRTVRSSRLAMARAVTPGESPMRQRLSHGKREIRTSGYPRGEGPGETVRNGVEGQDRDDGRRGHPRDPGGPHHGHPDGEDRVDPCKPRGDRGDPALQDGPAGPTDPRVPDDAGGEGRHRHGARGDAVTKDRTGGGGGT